LPIHWPVAGELVVQETKLHILIHRRIQIHFRGILLHSIVVDEANLERQWCVSWYGASSMRQSSAIKIADNPVQHSRTKHVDIRHHFLRDHVTRGDIALSHASTNHQLADIFRKHLDEARFVELRRKLGILDPKNLD
jgi:hypothetical protein